MRISSVKNDEGFTLFETILVLTVMVLLYSLVLQGIGRSFHRMKERTDLQQIIGDLRLLQTESKLKQADGLEVIFLPAHTEDPSGYQLIFGHKVINRELRGLKLAGEERKRVVIKESVIQKDDREFVHVGNGDHDHDHDRDIRYFTEENEVSNSHDLQKICFIGMSGKKYSLLLYSGGDIEVSTGED